MLTLLLTAALLAPPPAAAPADLVAGYIQKYFETFPSRATDAGWHDRDKELEDMSPERLRAWIDFNRQTLTTLSAELAAKDLSADDRLDAELLKAQVEWQLFELSKIDRPGR